MTPLFAGLIVAIVALGLPVDALPGAWPRPLVSAVTAALFLLLYLRAVRTRRVALLVCLVLAGLGEVVLSLVFGLYDYRGGGIPPFVPPGHVLLFALGTWVAARVPADLASRIAWVVLPASVVLALSGADELSLVLVLLYLAAIRYGPAPRLYGVMFLLALLLELWGTAIGTWSWRHQVPGLALHTLNPPLAAGAFYCVLDWLVQVLAPPLAILAAGSGPGAREIPGGEAGRR